MKAIPLALLLLASVSFSQDEGPPFPDDPNQLIAPIFPQDIGDVDSELYVTISEGERFPLDWREFYSDGTTETGFIYADIGVNTVLTHSGWADLTGRYVPNGWIRIRYPEPDRVHAFVKIRHRRIPLREVLVQAVRPARAFHMIIEEYEGESTGISIVNPTPKSQRVTIQFQESNYPNYEVRQTYLRIDPWKKESRFLHEFVDMEGLEIHPSFPYIEGVVLVRGQTEIAVGAVEYSRERNWFSTVLVKPEPLLHGAEPQ